MRAWVVPRDGSEPKELPSYLVGPEDITWPQHTMPVKKPAEPVQYFSLDDMYHCYLLREENVYVYIEHGRDANALPASVRTEIRRQLGVG
jgi:hypothetical protein